jgi:hypothetical protein
MTTMKRLAVSVLIAAAVVVALSFFAFWLKNETAFVAFFAGVWVWSVVASSAYSFGYALGVLGAGGTAALGLGTWFFAVSVAMFITLS